MMSQQQALAEVQDALYKKEITADKANVLLVQLMGVKVVNGPMMRQVRSQLMAAVKAGELGHLKKDGLKPECFFHKNGLASAIAIRNRIAGESIESLRKVFA